jgi:hypothetical protein
MNHRRQCSVHALPTFDLCGRKQPEDRMMDHKKISAALGDLDRYGEAWKWLTSDEVTIHHTTLQVRVSVSVSPLVGCPFAQELIAMKLKSQLREAIDSAVALCAANIKRAETDLRQAVAESQEKPAAQAQVSSNTRSNEIEKETEKLLPTFATVQDFEKWREMHPQTVGDVARMNEKAWAEYRDRKGEL